MHPKTSGGSHGASRSIPRAAVPARALTFPPGAPGSGRGCAETAAPRSERTAPAPRASGRRMSGSYVTRQGSAPLSAGEFPPFLKIGRVRSRVWLPPRWQPLPWNPRPPRWVSGKRRSLAGPATHAGGPEAGRTTGWSHPARARLLVSVSRREPLGPPVFAPLTAARQACRSLRHAPRPPCPRQDPGTARN